MSREKRPRWGLLQTFIIGRQGNPMMKRIRLIQTPAFGVYLHLIYREDLDPVPHDHPWAFWRMVLRGGYGEFYFSDPAAGRPLPQAVTPFRPSRFPTSAAHRIWYVEPGTVSLVVVGRKHRVWGFWGPSEEIAPRTWVDYRDALNLRPTEGVSG